MSEATVTKTPRGSKRREARKHMAAFRVARRAKTVEAARNALPGYLNTLLRIKYHSH